MATHKMRLLRDLTFDFDRKNYPYTEITTTGLDEYYVTDRIEFESIYHMDEMFSLGTANVELHHLDGSPTLMPTRYSAFDVFDTFPDDPPYDVISFFIRTETNPAQHPQPYGAWMIRAGHPNLNPYENYPVRVTLEEQDELEAPPFSNGETVFKSIPGIFECRRDGFSKTFEVRELALENFRVDKKVVNPESVSPFVTFRGDIRVYPNLASNDLPAWTPENDIDWQVKLRHPLIDDIVLTGTIVPGTPDNTGLVHQLEIQWDPGELATPLELPLEVLGGLKLELNSGGSTVSRPAKTHCIISRGTCKNPYTGIVHQTDAVSVYDGSPDLSTPLAYSGADSDRAPASFGYGWSSFESIKITELSDDSLVYSDEYGNYKRWLKNGPNDYEPLFEDNRLTLTVDSDPNETYTVTWRDGMRRVFDQYGKLRQQIARNGNTTTYSRVGNVLTISDDKGRSVYNHFHTGQPQPYLIGDSPTPGLGEREFLLTYDGEGRLASITDPVGDKTVFLYENGLLKERREELTNYHRSLIYEYEASETNRISSMKATSKKLDGNIVSDLYQVDYEYNIPVHLEVDPYEIHDYIATKITTIDLQPGSSEQPSAAPRVQFVAYDPLGRIIGEFVVAEDGLADEAEIDESTHVVTLHKYNDPSDPESESDDPWLRVETLQVNKAATTKWKHDARGNVVKMTDAQGNETLYSYTGTSYAFPDLVTEIQRPAYDRDNPSSTKYLPTVFSYNATNGNLESVEDSENNITKFKWRSDGQKIERITNRLGFKTYFHYGARDLLEKIYVQKNRTVTLDSYTDDVELADAGNFRKLELFYDDYDNLSEVKDANGNSIKTFYDAVNRPDKVIDGELEETTFEYVDRVLSEIQLPDVGTFTNRAAVTEYDSMGRVLQTLRKDNNHTAGELRVGFTYDGFSQLRSLIRIKNEELKAHRFSYDRQGRLKSSVDANEKESTTAYEPFCVGFANTSARGIRQKASFDSLCRMTLLEAGSPGETDLTMGTVRESREFLYDDLSRLVKTKQRGLKRATYGQSTFGQSAYGGLGEAEERTYFYDSLDRVEKVVFEDGEEISYLYDAEGNLTLMTENIEGAPKETQFTYYGDNLLYEVIYLDRVGGDQKFTYTYDAGGRLATLTYPASTGIVAYFDDGTPGTGWDGNGQLLHLRYVKGSDTIRRFEFEYDSAGNRISQLDVVDIASPLTQRAVQWVYGYDWLDRLESVRKAEAATAGALGTPQLVAVYTYDAADNRETFEVPDLDELYEYFYDSADNLTRIDKTVGIGSPATIETLESDDDGNLKTRVSGGVTTTYIWDDFNRLKAISTSDNSKKQSHTFGVSGFRRKKKDKDDVETTEYAAGLSTEVSKVTSGETITYLKAGGGIMGFERSSDGAMFWFINDALGTVRDVIGYNSTTSQWEVRASYEFDEYGQRIATSETGVSSQKTFVGGLSVQDEVADTGLMMMGHRFYAPEHGRFLNRDPIGFAGGANLFEYSNGNPVTFADPSGLVTISKELTQKFPGAQEALNALSSLKKVTKPCAYGDTEISESEMNALLGVINNVLVDSRVVAEYSAENTGDYGRRVSGGTKKPGKIIIYEKVNELLSALPPGLSSKDILKHVLLHEIIHEANQRVRDYKRMDCAQPQFDLELTEIPDEAIAAHNFTISVLDCLLPETAGVSKRPLPPMLPGIGPT